MIYFMPFEYTLQKFSSGMHYILLDAKTFKALVIVEKINMGITAPRNM